jgi:hypothetical protein
VPISRLDQATVGRRAARRGTVKPRTEQNGTCVRNKVVKKNKKEPNRVKQKPEREKKTTELRGGRWQKKKAEKLIGFQA